jgi:preprotein translocase subunit SecG
LSDLKNCDINHFRFQILDFRVSSETCGLKSKIGSEGVKFMTIIVVLHVLVCMALILIVLLQAGKGAEMGAAFGGASQTIFGSAGAMGFLTKLTTVAAIIFMLTSLLLTFASTRRASSTVMKERPASTAPASPSEMPVQPQGSVPEPKK